MKEYMLIKENCITNGRFVDAEALRWNDSPISIMDRTTWVAIGSLTSIRREGDTIIGVSEDFDRDVNLAINVDHIKSEITKDGIFHIKYGIIRMAIIEEKL